MVARPCDPSSPGRQLPVHQEGPSLGKGWAQRESFAGSGYQQTSTKASSTWLDCKGMGGERAVRTMDCDDYEQVAGKEEVGEEARVNSGFFKSFLKPLLGEGPP